MRVGVTGANGLLGTTVVPLWRQAGADVIAWTLADFDVVDAEAARRAIGEVGPDVVVHAAAYTDVDRAESEPDVVMRVNRDGTANVCRACAEVGATVVYISTDYVFDGTATAPIPPEAAPAPRGAYAVSKAEGERVVRSTAASWVVLRTGWAFGAGGANFVDTMRRAAVGGRHVTVVDDQLGAPTSTRLVAEGLWGLVTRRVRGVWHLTATGIASWLEVARLVFRTVGASPDIVLACSSAALGRPAPRPRFSVLDSSASAAALGISLPTWQSHVVEYVRSGRLPGLGLIGENSA